MKKFSKIRFSDCLVFFVTVCMFKLIQKIAEDNQRWQFITSRRLPDGICGIQSVWETAYGVKKVMRYDSPNSTSISQCKHSMGFRMCCFPCSFPFTWPMDKQGSYSCHFKCFKSCVKSTFIAIMWSIWKPIFQGYDNKWETTWKGTERTFTWLSCKYMTQGVTKFQISSRVWHKEENGANLPLLRERNCHLFFIKL